MLFEFQDQSIKRACLLRQAIQALASFDIQGLDRAIHEGFTSDSALPSSRVSWLYKPRAQSTTLLLALSQAADHHESVDPAARNHMIEHLLDLGADPYQTVPGDCRNIMMHLANARNLDAWKSVALRLPVADRRLLVVHAEGVGWQKAVEWTRSHLHQVKSQYSFPLSRIKR